MKRKLLLPTLATAILIFSSTISIGQLQITTNNNALQLARKIAGEGVTISNVTLTGSGLSSGFFKNTGNTSIGLDSGVVLSSGRVATAGFSDGMDGNGTAPAWLIDADNSLNGSGDPDLANALGIATSAGRDAVVLEFDFIPVGETIKFNYVFSSEEYNPEYVCLFNDAFAFFISGPGITGLQNIALVPNTTTPVSILNVNNISGSVGGPCINNPQYYVDNTSNRFFTHDGHTVIFTAMSDVQPCQTYHLKLVIMDVGDGAFDSGVFLEAGSLQSDPLKIDSHNPINDINLPYLAEGCTPGAIHVYRNQKKPFPQILNLVFAGTATNGVDVQTIPSTVTIPAGDSVVILPINTIADFVNEGHEKLKIYVGSNCTTIFSDSIEIELRDIDLLAITPPDNIAICRTSALPLETVPGYLNYEWTNAATLSSATIRNPIATPTSDSTNYICTATIGDCIAQDSILVKWKTISLVSKTDIPCKDGTNGSITVSGRNWEGVPQFQLNNGAFQNSATFNGLQAGTYWVKMKDASGCIDSIQVELVQQFPDVDFTADVTAATCSVTPDGKIEVTPSGGSGTFTYSSNGTSFQASNVLIVPEGTYTVHVKDGNGCSVSKSPVVVNKINTVTVNAEPDTFICEGTSYGITATSNATNITWTPANTLTNANTLTPTATPTATTKYYVTATFGTCSKIDSVTLNIWDAPIANAGNDVEICYGITAQLNGSGGTSFSWVPATTFVTATNIHDPIVKPTVPTSYFLYVTDDNGCTSLETDEVVVNVTPAVEIFAGKDTLVAMDQPLQLSAKDINASGITEWEWTDTRFLNDPTIANPVAIFTEPFPTSPYEYTYRITGTTPIGCQGFDDIKIKVYKGPEIYVPTAFTPNNDGRNDILYALPVGMKELKFFHVFNRWGQLIFTTKDPNKGWDGYVGGKSQSNSVYVWTAEGIDYMGNRVVRKGMVTLIR